MREVAGEVKESARGMGMTGWQKFRQVELPLATRLIAGGVRLALVQVWATATIAALVAGPGLGRLITDGFANSDYGKGIAGAVVVAAVALMLEVLATLAQRALDPVPSTDVTTTRCEATAPTTDVGSRPDTRGHPAAGHRR